MCHAAYSIICRIVFNAFFTILNKSGHIIWLQSLPIFADHGLFRRFLLQKRPDSELAMLLYIYILLACTSLKQQLGRTFWVILGQIKSIFGSHIGNHNIA
jgi:hypothetical protein